MQVTRAVTLLHRAATTLIAFVLIGAVPATARAERGTYPAKRLIAVVLKSSLGDHYSFFPHHQGSARCMIPRGGPPGARSVPGTCTTQTGVAKDGATVTFIEHWSSHSFHYQGTPQGEQRHFWRFLVHVSKRVTYDGQGGEFPPQFVR